MARSFPSSSRYTCRFSTPEQFLPRSLLCTGKVIRFKHAMWHATWVICVCAHPASCLNWALAVHVNAFPMSFGIWLLEFSHEINLKDVSQFCFQEDNLLLARAIIFGFCFFGCRVSLWLNVFFFPPRKRSHSGEKNTKLLSNKCTAVRAGTS